MPGLGAVSHERSTVTWSSAVPRLLCIPRQSVHKLFQCVALIRVYIRLQGTGERALQTSFPASATVVQVCPPPGQFAGWVDLHAIGCTHDADHRPLGQDFATAHTRPLGHMLHTLDRFLFGHLQSLRETLPVLAKIFVAALVLLAADHFTEFLIVLELHALLLAFLVLLFILRFIVIRLSGGLEDLGF